MSSISIIMQLNEDESILKLAQFRKLLGKQFVTKKEVELIIEGLDLNFKVPSTPFLEKYSSNVIGSTLLHLAYEKKNLDVFNILITRGADFNEKDKDGCTVLHKSFQDIFNYCNYLKATNQNRLIKSINLADSFMESVLSAHVSYKNTSNPSDCNGLTHFHIACATNNIEAVKLYLKGGVPVNQAANFKNFANSTPLHFAIYFTCPEVVKILLQHGANVNLIDIEGNTPLHACIERILACTTHACHGDVHVERIEEIRNLLLSHYADAKLLYAHVGIKHNSLLDVERLITQGYDVNQSISLDSQMWPGYSVLHFAVLINVNIAKLLIKHGANVTVRNGTGLCPLDLCLNNYKAEDIFDILCLVPSLKSIVLSNGKTKLVDLFFAFKDLDGISNFLQESDENIKLFVPFDSYFLPGFTVLHIAIMLSERVHCITNYERKEPDLSIVKKCLEQGADVTVKDLRNMTPIHFAFQLGKNNIVNLLLQYHNTMINSVNEANLSHLHIACAMRNYDLVEKFLLSKINVNIVYKGNMFISGITPGSTPLHIAVSKRDCQIVKLLLKFGADPHAVDYRFYTAIHYLADNNFSHELSKILFSSINFTDCIVKSMGSNYLHIACSTKNVDAVKTLLDLGVNVNQSLSVIKYETHSNCTQIVGIFNKTGNTPLHTTLIHLDSSQEQLDIVSLLIERGADILMKNVFNITPLRFILISQSKKLYETLISVLNGNICLRKRFESEIGLTMLHLACHKLDLDLMKELLLNGANVNAQIHEDSTIWPGFTPLHMLFLSLNGKKHNKQLIELLLKHRANVTLSNSKKRTPVHMAYHQLYEYAGVFRVDYVILLLKAQENFEINPTNIEGISHFHIACDLLDVDAVEKFLKHDVDVNSRIDMFCNSDKFAAYTPLLLVTRKTNLNPAESFAQLKIVDILIKHGANVNVADISGNTPAHLVASIDCSSARENLLQRLAYSGADINARNVRGEAPLELLMNIYRIHVRNAEQLRHQEVRHFIACGCILNAFNLLTGIGYIAKFFDLVPNNVTEYLLFGTYINFPDVIKKDNLNRSAIHNIVSSPSLAVEMSEFINCFDVLKKFGCDIDDQDSLGRTPLHLAVIFRSFSSIEALLLNGADINIKDKNNKTSLAYFFESCSHHISSRVCTQDEYKYELEFFVEHIKKLQLFNLHVDQLNEKLLIKALQKLDNIVRDQNEFLSQTKQLMRTKIERTSLTIAKFMSDNAAIVDYPTMSPDKRKAINEFFEKNKSDIQNSFEEVAGVLQLQYRKALKRYEIIATSLESLAVLTNYQFPYLVLHIILKFLKNSDLENLMAAAFHGKETTMQVH